MWTNSCHVEVLKRTWKGWTSATRPSEPSVKPAGVFIHAFAETTESAPPIPEIAIGTPLQKCAQPGRRSQP